MRIVSFRIDDETFNVLSEISRKTNTSKSEVVRRALKRYLSHKTPDERPDVQPKKIRIIL